MKVKSEEREERTQAELVRAVCANLPAVGFHIRPDKASVLHAAEGLAGTGSSDRAEPERQE
jgi:hypothetical protein